jgi:hypothetical protein
MKALLLFTYDAYLPIAKLLAKYLGELNYQSDIAHFYTGNNPCKKINCSEHEIKSLTIPDLNSKELLGHYDVIFIGAGGGAVRKTIAQIKKIKPKTFIITGFSGLCGHNSHEAFMSRRASDLILFNSSGDLKYYEDLNQLYYSAKANNGIVFGYPCTHTVNPASTAHHEIKTVCYADQNIVPEAENQRRHLAQKLIEYARHYPQRKLIVKMRNRKGSLTAHNDRFRLDEIILKQDIHLPNLSFEYDNIDNIIDSSDLVISVSSTCLIHALAQGKHVASLADYGFPDIFSNRIFLDSGICTTFDKLIENKIPAVSPEWFTHNVPNKDAGKAEFLRIIAAKNIVPHNVKHDHLPYVRAKHPKKTIAQKLKAKLFK